MQEYGRGIEEQDDDEGEDETVEKDGLEYPRVSPVDMSHDASVGRLQLALEQSVEAGYVQHFVQYAHDDDAVHERACRPRELHDYLGSKVHGLQGK